MLLALFSFFLKRRKCKRVSREMQKNCKPKLPIYVYFRVGVYEQPENLNSRQTLLYKYACMHPFIHACTGSHVCIGLHACISLHACKHACMGQFA